MTTNTTTEKQDVVAPTAVYPPLVAVAQMRKNSRQYERKPDTRYEDWVVLYETDEIFGAGIDVIVDYVRGAGVTVKIHDLNKDGEEVNLWDVPDVWKVIRRSKLNEMFKLFIKDALLNGTAYDELVRMNKADVKSQVFSIVNIPPGKVVVDRDEHMTIKQYVQDIGSDTDNVKFPVENVVAYRYHEITGKPYGCSVACRVIESSNILRNMGLDLAEFIGSKAYPPILWILGTPEKPWDKDDITAFIAARETVDPGCQIGVGGDCKADAIGVKDAVMDVEDPMNFFASKVVNGMQLPSGLSSVIKVSNQFVAEVQMTAFRIFIDSIRTDLKELFEVECFDEILRSYGKDNLYSEVVFEPHSAEEERVDVNNVIQLLNSQLYTKEFALKKLGDPVEEAQKGEFVQAAGVDPSGMSQSKRTPGAAASAAAAQVDPRKSQNKKGQVSNDGRAGSRRKTVKA